MLRPILAAALFATASAASAAPVYLKCTLDKVAWELAMNEDAGTVSWTNSEGSGNDPAIFTADSVQWGNAVFNLTVSRVDRSFVRKIGTGASAIIDKGICKVVPKAARAF